jgi:hypothetical protein
MCGLAKSVAATKDDQLEVLTEAIQGLLQSNKLQQQQVALLTAMQLGKEKDLQKPENSTSRRGQQAAKKDGDQPAAEQRQCKLQLDPTQSLQRENDSIQTNSPQH